MNATEQVRAPPTETSAGPVQVAAGVPGRVDAFNTEQNALTAAPGPVFVHVTVQVTAAPGALLAAAHAVVETMSALCSAKLLPVEPPAGTVRVMVLLPVPPAVQFAPTVAPVPAVQ